MYASSKSVGPNATTPRTRTTTQTAATASPRARNIGGCYSRPRRMTMSDPKGVGAQQHTIFAGQALGLSALCQVGFGKKRLDGRVTYTPELSFPDGESTGGGKQALQHVKLVPESGATLVIGTANVVDKSCELRTFRHMDELHRQRFKGRPFRADPAKYDQLIEELRG